MLAQDSRKRIHLVPEKSGLPVQQVENEKQIK